MRIGIFGITGVVGRELLKLFEDNYLNIPFNDIKIYASNKSVGIKIKFRDEELIIDDYDELTFNNLDVIFLCTSSEVSYQIYKMAKKYNCLIIDNSSYFRMFNNVPLIVPEINGNLIKENNLISNPNCCTALLTMVLYPISTKYSINKVIVSTYQSASGAGYQGLNELENQIKDIYLNKKCDTSFFGSQYLMNVFSHNSNIDLNNLYNDEENKIMEETKKILNKNINITATCIRVPVLRAHSESVYIEFDEEVDINEIKIKLNSFNGVKILDDIDNNKFPEPLKVENKNYVLVGRIRYGVNKKSISLFLCGDQLLKGAALNAYQILGYKINLNL